MSLGFGILGFLNYGPMSGYDLVKAFESSLQFFLARPKQPDLSGIKKTGKERIY